MSEAALHSQNEIQGTIQLLREALEAGDRELIRARLGELHPSDIAELLESLPPRLRDEVWEEISPEIEGDVLAHANDEVRAGLLEDMHPREVAEVTRELDADDTADIIQDLPEDKAAEVLRAMDEQRRQRVAHVLSYPEDTAGGLMDPDTVTVRSDVTLDVVLRYLRLRGEVPENTGGLFVVDRDNHYLGVLPLTTLLTEDPEKTVGEVMSREVEGIPADMPAEEVARLFESRDLISAAVVDEQGHLLGQITIDDVVDVIKEQGESALMSMAGLDEEEDMFAPVTVSARRRAVWLGINLITAFLASWVIGQFQETIDQIVALAVLMPIVASMGGIAGTQTLTVVIRGIALGQIGYANARALLIREVLVALINSLIWALVVGLVAGYWFDRPELGLIIGAAMIINLICAALFGAIIPLVLKRLSIDPALAGGVILTTVTDVVGFMAFLGLATAFLLH
ncbi:MAG: magnesium transporter [Gammaproteobacteria bacterium]|nr:MAG: magnesium transporter [Gammaproteobacteria bacterium]